MSGKTVTTPEYLDFHDQVIHPDGSITFLEYLPDRCTGLTNLAERGVGVRALMALAGHSNMATTQRYIDLRPAMLKAAVELV